MQSNIPYGTQWIKDLVPGVSWDAASQNIKMPDGSVLPKSSYTIVDSKAYVKPESVSKWAQPTQQTQPTQAQTTVTTPKVNQSSYAPSGTVAIRDMVPNVVWDDATKSITLPTGDVLSPSMYTLVNGRAYVNPSAIASYYQPKAITADSMQPWIDKLTEAYQPQLDNQYDRINLLIKSLQNKLNANIGNLQANSDAAKVNLQQQETADSQKLRNQAIARGTYTSGVADYQQEQLAGDYAPQYENLENTLASAIASATADTNANISELGTQASQLEDSFMSNIMNLVSSLMGTENATQQQLYSNMVEGGNSALSARQADLTSAVARTQLFGKVVTQADADALGVPVGTSSYEAISDSATLAAARSRSSGGGSSGGGGISGTNGVIGMDTDTKRAFDAAMKVWSTTGKAPAGILQSFGIPAGTAYTVELAAQFSQDVSVQDYSSKVQTRYPNIKNVNAEAAARALTYTNGTKSAALVWVDKNSAALQAAGVNIDTVKKAINGYDSGPSPYSKDSGDSGTPSWEFKWDQPSTWFD